MNVFVVVLVVGALLGLIGFAWWKEKKRAEWWRAYAERRGWQAGEGDGNQLMRRLSGFGLLERGRNRKILRSMRGEARGRTFEIFDYRFTTGSGKSQQTHDYTAIVTPLSFTSPGLVIRPEHFGDWLAGFFGFDDIDFEFDEFNSAFHVSADDKKFAYDVCSPTVMEFLLIGRNYAWELLGDLGLMYAPSSGRLEEAQIEAALAVFDGFLDRIPKHLQSGDPR